MAATTMTKDSPSSFPDRLRQLASESLITPSADLQEQMAYQSQERWIKD